MALKILLRGLRAELNPIHPLHEADQEVLVGTAERLEGTVCDAAGYV